MHFETHNMINYCEHEYGPNKTYQDCVPPLKDLRNQFVTRSTTVLENPCTSTKSIFCHAREARYTKVHGCYLYYDRESGKLVMERQQIRNMQRHHVNYKVHSHGLCR